MAINPEKTKKATAVIKYEDWKSSGDKNQRVKRNGHVEPWLEWSKTSRLESLWDRKIKGEAGKTPFKVEEKAVGDGEGETEISWTVWDDSKKLTNAEVELYSVMRAENRYLEEGYIKTASKYCVTFYKPTKDGGKFPIDVENLGVDSFFYNKENKYIFCESKFTRDEGKFDGWEKAIKDYKADPEKKPKRIWNLMGRYMANKEGCRQMSWEWIEDRAALAVDKPSGMEKKTRDSNGEIVKTKVSSEERAKIKAESLGMKRAAIRKKGKRIVNVYGAAEVPVYPGEYRFISSEGGRISDNVLKVEWPIDVNKDEFLELNDDFDAWLYGMEEEG